MAKEKEWKGDLECDRKSEDFVEEVRFELIWRRENMLTGNGIKGEG